MFILPTLAAALAFMQSSKAVAIDKRQATGANFKCNDGYELTAYTSAGLATCTRIEGSGVTPGYSGQTVVFVGLISGLTGLIVSCTPIAQYIYRSGRLYFTNNGGPQYHNAFPRASVDSAVARSNEGDELHGVLHDTWYKTFAELQAHSYDPSATYSKSTNGTHTTGTYVHNGFTHEHAWYLVPHNKTHDGWRSHYQISKNSASTDNSASLQQRGEPEWWGVQAYYENLALDGRYYGIGITEDNSRYVGEVIGGRYIDSVQNSDPGRTQVCSYLGSEQPGKPKVALIGVTTQLSQNGPYQTSLCNTNWLDGLPYHDELR